MTDITGTFTEAFNYVKQDWSKLVLVGIICLLGSLGELCTTYGISGGVSIIASIIGLIFTLILCGFELNVIKNNINSNGTIPDFDWKNNFIDGIKLFVLNVVYFIIPVIIVGIVAFFTVDSSALSQIMTHISNGAAATIPATLINSFVGSLAITIVVGIILFILFGLMACIASCRLAAYDTLNEGLNFKAVFDDISKIGWVSYIVWIIILFIIAFVIAMIGAFISMIPYVGIIIYDLIILSFLSLFVSSATGRLYSQL